eukprot:CAMPEP_0204279498 /NCGR_PEP_ID=MMETSP0468-20130131/35322_1 /ASSEMBLY_ACC=CAM_ASM_000383 /TAXON_ID=2969 /ORGANISM="Oxyrrhis marina" /LENGTH=67 /DNA_ID=CAMNT_0051256603 /DNA_START=16 /DNA_END=216 /DNA_ORIENTATION=+
MTFFLTCGFWFRATFCELSSSVITETPLEDELEDDALGVVRTTGGLSAAAGGFQGGGHVPSRTLAKE